MIDMHAHWRPAELIDALAVHAAEVEPDVIERLIERRLTHPRRLQHLHTICIAHDTRFPNPSAQGIGDVGGPPMGMHVDHVCFLHMPAA